MSLNEFFASNQCPLVVNTLPFGARTLTRHFVSNTQYADLYRSFILFFLFATRFSRLTLLFFIQSVGLA